ncbi:MAG: PSD1 and planctomycete cytochrome C domain-containing protein [Pirellulales bacterium]|nr:PSD1 and planctomycete cytochrome C domain-containing protein [Pirellulales bacterium]
MYCRIGRTMRPWGIGLVLVLAGGGGGASAVRGDEPPASATTPAAASPTHKVDYNRQIRPILSNNCFQCHGPDAETRQAGLRLDLPEESRKPLESGNVAIVPSHPEKSELVARVMADDPAVRMPPAESNKHLSDADRALLKQWIAAGADVHRHWAFEPVRRPEPPTVNNTAWPRGAIDQFIVSRLEQAGMRPAPEADRTTLIRRLTLDLTGLPPTVEEIDAFLLDNRPDAYERVVERLFQSPHHGERLALEWLDAARFADTHGYHIDSGRDMTRWRAWVIDAFNRNLPFDQFTVEQLAGDLLPDATVEQRVASGFHRNHMINFEGGAIPEEYHNAYIVDRVNTTATVWLGLTIACAQCHDHKFDPVTQREYYQLYAFFYNVPESGLDGSKGNARPLVRLPSPEQEAESTRLKAEAERLGQQLAGPLPEVDAAQAAWELATAATLTAPASESLPAEVRAALALPAEKRTADQQTLLRKHYREQVSPEIKQLNEQLAAAKKLQAELDRQIPTAMVMEELAEPRETFVRMRGQYDKLGEKVAPAVPASLPALPPGAPGNRLGLARWLVAAENPLVSRVIVNRYWQMFFGTGLVKTAEDFGSQGELPSHPELLDWLASEFVSSGWDVRHLVRLIVTSATYRQSSQMLGDEWSHDPENRLLARGPRLRLPAEFIRDQALAVSGLLNRQIGGASVSPYQPPGLWEELASREDGANWTAQTYTQSHGADLYRRTMYTYWKRTSPPPTLVTFDAPDRETCTVRRARTNTPLQALVLMNDPTYVEASRKLAERIMIEAPAGAAARMAWVYRQVLGRQPTARQAEVLTALFDEQLAKYRAAPALAEQLLTVGEAPRNAELDATELAAWSIVSSVLLNLDETVTKE